MIHRESLIEDGLSLADSGTKTIDLEVVDPISELHLLFAATNGATSNLNNPCVRNISKIEIVDGSEVFYSMDGRLAQALAYWWTKNYPGRAWQEYGGAGQWDVIPIYFGRFPWDPDYAIVPANFKNLQLKITWDLATVNTVGATGFVTNTAQLWVNARLMQDPFSPPRGYFIHKNQYSFTSVASGDERVDMPTDYPYAGIMIRAWESGVGINASISNVKMSIDTDKIIPFDDSIAHQMRLLGPEYGEILHGIRQFASDGDVRQIWIGLQERGTVVSEVDSKIVGLTNVVNGQAEYSVYTDAGAADTTDRMMQTLFQGQAPFNTMWYPFGRQIDPVSYLEAATYGSIRILLTQADADAAVDVVLSQLRS